MKILWILTGVMLLTISTFANYEGAYLASYGYVPKGMQLDATKQFNTFADTTANFPSRNLIPTIFNLNELGFQGGLFVTGTPIGNGFSDVRVYVPSYYYNMPKMVRTDGSGHSRPPPPPPPICTVRKCCLDFGRICKLEPWAVS